MHRILSTLSLLCLTAVLAIGCSPKASEGPAQGVRVGAGGYVADAPPPAENGAAMLQMNTVVVLDKGLQNGNIGKLSVENTVNSRTATGALQVKSVLRNRTDKPLQLEARTQFFDASQIPVEGPTSWQRVFLSAQATGVYEINSVGTTNVVYYRVEVREGR